MSDHAHPNCNNGHICQQPSGRVCVEAGCDQPAGTLWCPDHDRERLDRISASFDALVAGQAPAAPGEVT